MLEEASDLLATLGRLAREGAPGGWRSITINMRGLGNGTSTRAAADTPDGEKNVDLGGLVGPRAAHKLRKVMFREGTGTWYRATLTIDSAGQLVSDFDYEARPYDLEDEGTEPIVDLLMRDQKKYPRDHEHLPEWHPAKHVEA
jgi:hypothetical protein